MIFMLLSMLLIILSDEGEDSRSNPFKKEGSDENSASKDHLLNPSGSITKSRAKRSMNACKSKQHGPSV